MPDSLKIALLANSISRANGGITPVINALGTEFQRRGHQVHCFTAAEEHTAADCQLPVTAVRGRRLGLLTVLPGIRAAIAGFAPDVIHLHGLWGYGSVIAPTLGKPVVISPHGMVDPWALRHSAWKKQLARRLYENRNFKRAACFHALCEAEAASIAALGVTAPIITIPNGVTLPPDPAALPHAGKKMLFLGRIHPKKGLLPLLEAWSRVRPADWTLNIAGWAQLDHDRELQARAEALGIAGAVEFGGPVFGAAKDHLFRSADAFVLSSFSEGLPMNVLEAWSYRLPVLMSRQCNLPEGFRNGAALECGNDPESIASALRKFFALSDEARCEMGGRGARLVREVFTWEEIARQMLNQYERVIR